MGHNMCWAAVTVPGRTARVKSMCGKHCILLRGCLFAPISPLDLHVFNKQYCICEGNAAKCMIGDMYMSHSWFTVPCSIQSDHL